MLYICAIRWATLVLALGGTGCYMYVLAVSMDVLHLEAKQLGGSPGTEGHRLEMVFFSCFLDLAVITFLTLCLPFTEPFGWQFTVSPRQALLCCMQLIKAAITFILESHHCSLLTTSIP